MSLRQLASTGVFAALVLTSLLNAHQPQEQILAGWPGIFPLRVPYIRRFEKPKADKKSWQQSASYEWSGGRVERIRVTLMRDAGEATKYQFGAKNPLPGKVKKITIAEHIAYDFGDGKLVIDLTKDRLIILEAPTWKRYQSDLAGFAKRFDLKACAKALDNPPYTGSRRKVEAFRELKKGMSLGDVQAWVGNADKDIGSGIHILAYKLDDGSRVLIGFPDFKKLIYVKHVDKAGKSVDLAK